MLKSLMCEKTQLKNKGVFIISKEQTDIISGLKLTTKIITIIMAMLIIMLIVTMILYKPVYKVSFNGENIGYINNKDEFVNNLDNYLNQSDEKIAYIHIDSMPDYKFFLLKKENSIDNESVLEMVKAEAIIYNRVYTVNTKDSEVATFETMAEAQKFVSEMDSKNIIDNVDFVVNEAHISNPVLTNYDEAMQTVQLKYVEQSLPKVDLTAKTTLTENDLRNVDVVFASPARGTITSRYGYRSSDFHTGIDIANPVGTPIYAAADGKVIFSGSRNTYGRTVIIEHADNMITYYAHCDELFVNEGDIVTLGTKIATIGLTGRTTGPHVHFEVRINNETVNPQNYVSNIGK